ncbi:MAG: glycosyltransferase WbuB, partial [Flavobacterium sp.]|nr:glycosyltransferase WbuB [Flavobacterium sp.]
MKEIVIVSNYYPPEKGAAANRIEQMALKLQQNGYSVKVVCPLGNYPYGKLFPEYRNKFTVTENRQGIIVKRLWIFPSNSGNIFKRLLSIKSFSAILFGYLLFAKLPHRVIVQSPPLLLSFIAVAVLSLKKKKIILNVSDLWPLAAVELNAVKSGSISHKILLRLEKYIYKNATVVLGQSDEIISHVRSLAPGKQCYLYRNYPDHQHVYIQPQPHQKIKIFYAGLLG